MLDSSLIQVVTEEKKLVEEKYIPHVVEPSFGIGRIVYVILEHSFKIREDEEKRTLFLFPPCIAPVKCSILPLIPNEEKLIAKISGISMI
jgi:glycyl-tRNA synthetase